MGHSRWNAKPSATELGRCLNCHSLLLSAATAMHRYGRLLTVGSGILALSEYGQRLRRDAERRINIALSAVPLLKLIDNKGENSNAIGNRSLLPMGMVPI